VTRRHKLAFGSTLDHCVFATDRRAARFPVEGQRHSICSLATAKVMPTCMTSSGGSRGGPRSQALCSDSLRVGARLTRVGQGYLDASGLPANYGVSPSYTPSPYPRLPTFSLSSIISAARVDRDLREKHRLRCRIRLARAAAPPERTRRRQSRGRTAPARPRLRVVAEYGGGFP
jgi:hypothetical protein